MKADLHIHSEYSWDSKVPIQRYIELAEEKGIDVIAITDHNDTQSHSELIRLQKTTSVLLVPGQEINTSDGHLLIYGWISTIPRDLTMSETVKLARLEGKKLGVKVICIAAHPFDYLRSGKGSVTLSSDIDGIEIFNASALFGWVNWLAKFRSRDKSIIKLSNSDCHRSSEFALAYNEIPDVSSVDELFSVLSHAKTKGRRIGWRRKINRFARRKLGKMTI